MRVMLIAGARPNFMKISPVLRELRRRDHEAVLVHTGQHYDVRMSDAFFQDLELPAPDHHLGVGSGSHAEQTARVMTSFEPVLRAERPDWLVVVGDVNSTLACALVASKLEAATGCRIAHVEAGLRSRDWRMPEEVNRVLTDRLSHLLLTPSPDARPNLVAEGIDERRIEFVGNVMIDTLMRQLPRARGAGLLERLKIEREGYAAVTLHRPSNVDDPEVLREILRALALLAAAMPVMIPLHPRTRKNVEAFGLMGFLKPLRILEPLGYLDMLALTDGAAVVVTDSGGLQEETTALGVPCVTLREQTERPITIEAGTNQLAPWPLDAGGILTSVARGVATGRVDPPQPPEGWDGHAAERVVDALELALRPESAPRASIAKSTVVGAAVPGANRPNAVEAVAAGPTAKTANAVSIADPARIARNAEAASDPSTDPAAAERIGSDRMAASNRNLPHPTEAEPWQPNAG